MKRKSKKGLAFYLGLKYPVQIAEQAEGGYFAKVLDLPGCMSQGETVEQALAAIAQARKLWLEEAYESGLEIPLPTEEKMYSGKFLVRLPRLLHARLAQESEREGISLNQYVVSRLAESYGATIARDRPRSKRRTRRV